MDYLVITAVVVVLLMVSWRLVRSSVRMIKEGLAGLGTVLFTIGALSLICMFTVLQHRDERPSPTNGCYEVTRDAGRFHKVPGSVVVDGVGYLPIRCP